MMALLQEQLASSGGPILVALLVISVAAGAIAIFKTIQFFRAGVGRRAGTAAALSRWSQGEFEAALQAARDTATPASAASAGAMASLIAYPTDKERAREVASHIALSQIDTLGRHLRFLETVAQAAPMLGLLGTVIGMISAFGELSSRGGAIDPTSLAGGIWVALITTAAGLMVAIPVYFLSMWFEARLDGERTAIEAAVTKVLFSVRTPEKTEEPARSFRPPVRIPAASLPASLGG
jgi:biopolymer transport protein ExbB